MYTHSMIHALVVVARCYVIRYLLISIFLLGGVSIELERLLLMWMVSVPGTLGDPQPI